MGNVNTDLNNSINTVGNGVSNNVVKPVRNYLTDLGTITADTTDSVKSGFIIGGNVVTISALWIAGLGFVLLSNHESAMESIANGTAGIINESIKGAVELPGNVLKGSANIAGGLVKGTGKLISGATSAGIGPITESVGDALKTDSK